MNDSDGQGIDARIAQRDTMLRDTQPTSSSTPTDPLEMRPIGPSQPHGKIPNTPGAVAFISFLLGGLFFISLASFLFGGYAERWWWATPQLAFFFAAWSGFHWGEFMVTAGWNREKCSVDSFLLDNGALYHVAHGIALTEYIITLYLKPSWKMHPYISVVGFALVLVGQTLRTVAMIHASTNFSHAVAFRKAERHQLVTDGIYAWFRHPSYAGFYYWALGTQSVLQNPISFVLYSLLLWRFFYYRIRSEEAALIRFFGESYVEYRSRVGTKIPFVP